ncbi:MAG: diphthine synthase [Archaeoglobaceae archaeon]
MLFFIGMGLWDEKDISLKGYEWARKCDEIFIEFYTSHLGGTTLHKIESLLEKDVDVLERSDLEENSATIIEKAVNKNVAILVPGDPMIATTHSAISLEARKKGVEVSVIYNASILTAVCGLTGLHNYRFGKSASISYPHGEPPKSPINTIQTNWDIDAHTLLFLDLHPEPMKISVAIGILEKSDEENALWDSYAVGIARAGSDIPFVKCDRLQNLKEVDFGEPLHALVILAPSVHFMEYDFLKEFAAAPGDLENRIS